MTNTPFVLGTTNYSAPPLSIFALRQPGVWDAITTLGQTTDIVTEMDKYLTILCASLSQTSTPVSMDDLRRQATIADFRNMDAFTLTLFRASGMAGGDSGESPAVSPSEAQSETGTT